MQRRHAPTSLQLYLPRNGFVLFRRNETAFVQTKRKLLDDCDLWCIVSLPSGVFNAAGAGVKTNLLFFTKSKSTERIWCRTSRLARRLRSRWTGSPISFGCCPNVRTASAVGTVDIAVHRCKADALRAQPQISSSRFPVEQLSVYFQPT
jgi:hypothetical protein